MSSATAVKGGLDSQQKFTRYKSVRKPNKPLMQEQNSHHAPVPEISSGQVNGANVGVSRSMSRYKKPRAQTAWENSNTQHPPAVPQMPQQYTQMQQPLVQSTAAQQIQQQQQQQPQQQGRSTANSSRYRNVSAPASHSQAQLPTRTRTRTNSSAKVVGQDGHTVFQTTSRTSRRGTQSSQGQAIPAGPAQQGMVYVDPYAQIQQTQVQHVQMQQKPLYEGQLPTYVQQGVSYTQESEEDRVRRMMEQEKQRQQRLRDEQRKREARLAAEKAKKQRQAEEEELKKEEEIVREAEAKRLLKEKAEEAKRLHQERKKLQSRSLFSRGRPSNDGSRQSSDPDNRYGARQEVMSPPADNDELPSRRIDARVVARPYQSPTKIRKESISHPLKPPTPPESPPKAHKNSISQSVAASVPRPSISQRPADPFFDAPKSAANPSERSAVVYYNSMKGVVDVNPMTTVEDLLRSAAKEMPNAGIDPINDVVMECFSQQEHQGLERRMRRFEVVQKVMDSWDFDRKNRFSIIKGNVGGTDNDLILSTVQRRGEPRDATMVRMYYSSATPGTKPSWGLLEKHQLCILRPDGQVLVSKSDDERNAVAACHMADFELFIPTPEQMKRIKQKGKKTYVFAIKSQSKAAVYMESNNYVHYFSTKDRLEADRWYMAVQNWRSWYMVERLGYGKPPEESSGGWIGKLSIEQGRDAGPAAPSRAAPPLLGTFMDEDNNNNNGGDFISSIMQKYDSGSGSKRPGRNGGGDDLDLSKEALGYDLGGLISRIPQNEHSYDGAQQQSSPQRDGGIGGMKSFDRRGGPPISFPSGNKDPGFGGEEPFAPGGLLGRSYSQRKAQQEIAGRSSLDQSNDMKMSWGRPLVEFGNESSKQSGGGNGRNGQNARKPSVVNEGPLVARI